MTLKQIRSVPSPRTPTPVIPQFKMLISDVLGDLGWLRLNAADLETPPITPRTGTACRGMKPYPPISWETETLWALGDGGARGSCESAAAQGSCQCLAPDVVDLLIRAAISPGNCGSGSRNPCLIDCHAAAGGRWRLRWGSFLCFQSVSQLRVSER